MVQGLRPVPWRACLLVFVVGLVFRLGIVVATDQIHGFPRKEMVRIAMAFAARGELADPFAAPTGPTALASPIYPIFLGLIFRTFGTGVAAEVVKCVLTSAVSALRWALIPWLAVCLGLGLRTGMIGGLMGAFYIGALATDIKGDWAEAYAATALVGFFFAAIRISNSGPSRLNVRSAAVLGLWWGLAVLLSPALTSILGAFVLVGALRFLRESPRQYVQFVAVLGLVAALVISPWPIRNAIRLGSPIWAKDNFGIILLASNHPGAGWDVLGNEVFIEQTTPSWQPSVALKLKAVGEVAYDKSQAEEAKRWIRANPGTFARLVALRVFHFWFPLGRNAAHTALEWGLTLLSTIGLYLLYFKHRAAALLILGIWLLYPPVYYIVLWSSRYRYPINWTLMFTAAVAVSHAVSVMQARLGWGPRGVQ
jgi:hypothetical protein